MAGGAGSITASTPVVVVEDRASGRRAFHFLMEGFGRTLILGMRGEDVYERLRWLRDEPRPRSTRRCRRSEASTATRSWSRRSAAATSCTTATRRRRRCWPSGSRRGFARAGVAADVQERLLEFMRGNPQFFVAVSLAASRLMLDAGHGIDGLEPPDGGRRQRRRVRDQGVGARRRVVHGAGRGPRGRVPGGLRRGRRWAGLRRLAARRVRRAGRLRAPGRARPLAAARRRRGPRPPDLRRHGGDRGRRAPALSNPACSATAARRSGSTC